MTLPPRKKPKRSGIQRAPKRVHQRHRNYIRSHGCCVPGCLDGPIEVAHVRLGQQAGMGIKPPDHMAISLCRTHHQIQHNIGHAAFDKQHGIDSLNLAAEFSARSPDVEMKRTLSV